MPIKTVRAKFMTKHGDVWYGGVEVNDTPGVFPFPEYTQLEQYAVNFELYILPSREEVLNGTEMLIYKEKDNG